VGVSKVNGIVCVFGLLGLLQSHASDAGTSATVAREQVIVPEQAMSVQKIESPKQVDSLVQSGSVEQSMSPRLVIPPEQIRQELEDIVAAFNQHAQGLDTRDPVLVEAFITFIANRLAKHWDPRDMAIELLGSDVFDELSRIEQQQISARLETTFHRYAFEVVEEYRQSPMVLMATHFASANG
jgi:hypothetical protein